MPKPLEAGRVLSIRVRPVDCMSAIDVLTKAGQDPTRMSFAAVVNTALSISLATLRDLNLIPTREGFEYTEMMEVWNARKLTPHATKLALTKSMKNRNLDSLHSIPDALLTPAQQIAKIRVMELQLIQSTQPEKWTPEMEAELAVHLEALGIED